MFENVCNVRNSVSVLFPSSCCGGCRDTGNGK